jgi:peptidoglycan/xylan/chitin deacetylase (PgdA/CDA1 family)
MGWRRYLYSNSIYRAGKQLLFEVLFRSGAVHLFRGRSRDSVLVLIYHDILPPGFPEQNPLFGMTVSTTEFEWQLRYLRKRYAPISFQQFADWFFNGAMLPPNPVLITFDDGHRNNLDFALPALKKLGFPAVCFAVAGSLGEKSLTWFEDAYYRLMFTPYLSWKLTNGEVRPLTSPAERSAACGRFFTLCRSLSADEQHREIQSLQSQLGVESPNVQFPGRFEFLSADDLRSLQENGIEIGAHTMTHPILSTLAPYSAQIEIRASKAQLEKNLPMPVRAFAYPFGAPDLDFTERDRDYVRQSDFTLAFAGEGGSVKKTCDAFNLPRVGIGRMNRAQFATTITGTTATLKSLLVGLRS